jgi:hypothetical protein
MKTFFTIVHEETIYAGKIANLESEASTVVLPICSVLQNEYKNRELITAIETANAEKTAILYGIHAQRAIFETLAKL